jgi:hypothetical protein
VGKNNKYTLRLFNLLQSPELLAALGEYSDDFNEKFNFFGMAAYRGDACSIYNMGAILDSHGMSDEAQLLYRVARTCFGRLLWKKEDEEYDMLVNNTATLASIALARMDVLKPGGDLQAGLESLEKLASKKLNAYHALGLAYLEVNSIKDVEKSAQYFLKCPGYFDANVFLMEYFQSHDMAKALDCAAAFVSNCNEDYWPNKATFAVRTAAATSFLLDHMHASAEKGKALLLKLPDTVLITASTTLIEMKQMSAAQIVLECSAAHGYVVALEDLGHMWYNREARGAQSMSHRETFLCAANYYKRAGKQPDELEARFMAQHL